MQYRFLTSTRDDLVTLSKIFAEAVKPKILTRGNKPIVVRVNGAYKSGKKIIPDIMREELLGVTPEQCEGKREFDERFVGELNGQQVRADFINIAWEDGYYIDVFDTVGHKVRRDQFIGLSKLPGLVFIHNDLKDVFFRNTTTYDLDIWVEGISGVPTGVVRDRRRLVHGSRLRETFGAIAAKRRDNKEDETWVRYVELNVNKYSSVSRDALQCIEPARKVFKLFEEPVNHAAKPLQAGIYAYT